MKRGGLSQATCPPKTNPGAIGLPPEVAPVVVRVSTARKPGKEAHHETEAAHAGSDHPEATGGGGPPGKGRGVICVQSEQKRTVTEAELLDALYEETVAFADRVERGDVELSQTGGAGRVDRERS